MQVGDVTAAIELGTSCTAYAYTVVGREYIWQSSPGDGSNEEHKTLTAVLMQRCDEGEAEGGWRVAGFGYTAEEDYLLAKADEAEGDRGDIVFFKCFTMELYQGGREQLARMDVDEPMATAVGGEFLPMIFVVSKAIEYIKNQILDRVSLIAKDDDARLMWVVTVPAIWSNFGKRFMRAASYRAGLIVDENDMKGLKVCSEPEAALLAVETSNQGVGSWYPGDQVMVLNCGDQTMDVTSYLMESCDPLQLSQLAEPCGGAGGGSIVDARFKAFFQAAWSFSTHISVNERQDAGRNTMVTDEFFDNASGDVPRLEGTHELFAITEHWQKQKTLLKRGESLRVSIEDIASLVELSPRQVEKLRKIHNDLKPKELHVSGARRNLVFPPALVESFFRGAITAIKEQVSAHLSDPDLRGLRYIYAVGAFCDTPLVQSMLHEELADPGTDLRVVAAQRPGLAVVVGAALFGARGAISSVSGGAGDVSSDAASGDAIHTGKGEDGNTPLTPVAGAGVDVGGTDALDDRSDVEVPPSDARLPALGVPTAVGEKTNKKKFATKMSSMWKKIFGPIPIPPSYDDLVGVSHVETPKKSNVAIKRPSPLEKSCLPDGAEAPLSTVDAADLTAPRAAAATTVAANGSGSGGGGAGRVDSILAAAKRASLAAQSSSISCVPEVGMLMETLVNLAADNRGNGDAFKTSRQLCENLTAVLNNAETLLRKGSNSDTGRNLLEGVQERVRAVVEVMEAYQRKTRLKQIWKASIYRKRVEEAEVAARTMLEYFNAYTQGESLRQTLANSEKIAKLADPFLRRRQRVEDLIKETEIGETEIEIDRDIVIGSGGSSTVFLANYDGVNAACKVMSIKGYDDRETENQRKSFLREVRNMRRLNNSPRVVRVFGILTSRPSELVMVMEYMAGGDLFSFIYKHREQNLPDFSDKLTRSIIEDIAKGLAHLHKHDTWHGDLKSLNILLTADHRASISDFGTSHWTAQTTTNRLHSQTPGTGGYNQLSFHWAAPEILEHGSPSEQLRNARHSGLSQSEQGGRADVARLSFMSDVYSFGVVVWEVISKEVPWAKISGGEMYRRVCMIGDRPAMPLSAPADLADLVRACWHQSPTNRPTCDQILACINGEHIRTT